MTPARLRLFRLKRLERMRDVARLEALDKASLAERDFARHARLAQRSEELAGAFAHRWEAACGGDLRDLRQFHSSLRSLSADTARSTDQARQAADFERLQAAAASRQRDLVQDQRRAAQKAAVKAKDAKALMETSHRVRTTRSFGTVLE